MSGATFQLPRYPPPAWWWPSPNFRVSEGSQWDHWGGEAGLGEENGGTRAGAREQGTAPNGANRCATGGVDLEFLWQGFPVQLCMQVAAPKDLLGPYENPNLVPKFQQPLPPVKNYPIIVTRMIMMWELHFFGRWNSHFVIFSFVGVCKCTNRQIFD